MKLTKNDLEIILQEGEGQTIEFKESFTPSVVKDIVAFANSIGGRIFIGVDDTGKIKGLNITNKIKSQISDLSRNCDPSISIDLQMLSAGRSADGGNVLVVTVAEGANKPYQYREGFFLRQGPNSQKLTRDQIIQFYIDENKIRFDTQANTKFKYPEDFDNNLFKQYLESINMKLGYKDEDVLVNLGVAQNKSGNILFNNAGILFFAKEPCKFFPSVYVDAVVFKGTERVDVIDRKTFKSGLLENLNRARVYLQEHLNVRYEYRENWKRENIYELPLDALREAAANALMHRDYFITGANITVAIFDDRVEISSPGGLPKPLKVEDLGKMSKRRNEIIADLFSRLDYVEKLGTGINKIRNWMKEAGLKMPKMESNGFFFITFYRHVGKMSLNVPKISPNVAKMSLKNVAKKERVKYIISKIESNEPFTLKTLAKELNVEKR
ncbi:MAG: putative DNA binding domain-containing protein, partial [Elusimicrobia bacterium]|nr:putative DNA binding domain-containing protein [Elusimicrobiota bacterium]